MHADIQGEPDSDSDGEGDEEGDAEFDGSGDADAGKTSENHAEDDQKSKECGTMNGQRLVW